MNEARRVQLERFRQMTPGERLGAASALYWSARRLKGAHLKSLHPDWSDAQIQAEVKRLFSHVRG